MEGAQFNSTNHSRHQLELVCAGCGHRFRPRHLPDEAEELCDFCYEAQFEPTRLRHWQRGPRPHAHLRGSA